LNLQKVFYLFMEKYLGGKTTGRGKSFIIKWKGGSKVLCKRTFKRLSMRDVAASHQPRERKGLSKAET